MKCFEVKCFFTFLNADVAVVDWINIGSPLLLLAPLGLDDFNLRLVLHWIKLTISTFLDHAGIIQTGEGITLLLHFDSLSF